MEIEPRTAGQCRHEGKGREYDVVRMTVITPKKLVEALAEEARRLDTSASEIVRELIRAYLEGQK
jgi:metal-responsive CopG/Arc/MetJ family transcriptional regulator